MIHSVMHRMHNPSFALLLLRIGVGTVFVFHGYQKLTAMDQTVGFFATIGISAFWTYAVAWTEFAGGLLLIVGLFVRYAGLALAIVMAFAVYLVHLKNGFNLANGGYEYALLLLLASLALSFMGAGRYSLASWFKHPMVCTTCEVGHS